MCLGSYGLTFHSTELLEVARPYNPDCVIIFLQAIFSPCHMIMFLYLFCDQSNTVLESGKAILQQTSLRAPLIAEAKRLK
jgi:hypothetical protein